MTMHDDRSLAGWADIIQRSAALAAQPVDAGCPSTDTRPDLDAAEVRYAHTVHDYETFISADYRMLLQYRDLLTDGLHALRNGSPAVTDEFIDRTLVAMTKRIDAHKGRHA